MSRVESDGKEKPEQTRYQTLLAVFAFCDLRMIRIADPQFEMAARRLRVCRLSTEIIRACPRLARAHPTLRRYAT